MKNILLYLTTSLLVSCAGQNLPIIYDSEQPTEAQINYTENKSDKNKHYLIFRDEFNSHTVKVYDRDKLLDEDDLEPVDPSLGIHHISILDRKNRRIKIVFDDKTYYLELEQEYQYVFLNNYDNNFTGWIQVINATIPLLLIALINIQKHQRYCNSKKYKTVHRGGFFNQYPATLF